MLAGDAAREAGCRGHLLRLALYSYFRAPRSGATEFMWCFRRLRRIRAVRIAERIEHAVSGIAVSRLADYDYVSIGLNFAGRARPRVEIERGGMALYKRKAKDEAVLRQCNQTVFRPDAAVLRGMPGIRWTV